MPHVLMRVAVGLAAAPMALYVEPWDLPWCACDAGFGALLFVAINPPPRPEGAGVRRC